MLEVFVVNAFCHQGNGGNAAGLSWLLVDWKEKIR